MTDTTLAPWLAPVVFSALFVALWVGVSLGLAGAGWRAFARRHPATTVPTGPVYTAWYARFRSLFAGYRNVVRVACLPQGLHCSAMFLFRPGHPPFVVPWASVVRAEHQALIVGSCYEVDIEDSAGTLRLRLPPAAAAEIDVHRARRR
ncbi:MAG: hypothetical protein ACREUW_15725 [Burkholderiales bacterium]